MCRDRDAGGVKEEGLRRRVSPPQPTRGLWEGRKLPQRVRAELVRKRFWCFETLRPIILVFLSPRVRSLRKSDGFTPNGGAKYKGVAIMSRVGWLFMATWYIWVYELNEKMQKRCTKILPAIKKIAARVYAMLHLDRSHIVTNKKYLQEMKGARAGCATVPSGTAPGQLMSPRVVALSLGSRERDFARRTFINHHLNRLYAVNVSIQCNMAYTFAAIFLVLAVF